MFRERGVFVHGNAAATKAITRYHFTNIVV